MDVENHDQQLCWCRDADTDTGIKSDADASGIADADTGSKSDTGSITDASGITDAGSNADTDAGWRNLHTKHDGN